MPNVVTIEYSPNKKQALFHSAGEDEVVYGGAKGGGKALALDTLIPTPDGWKTMADIKPGDVVFGENGEPVTVLAATGVMIGRPCYKVIFDDGSEIIADEQHLWKTYTFKDLRALTRRSDEYRERRRKTREKRGTGKRPDLAKRNQEREYNYKSLPTGDIRTTKEILETLHYKGTKNHAVMNAKPLDLPHRELPIDPYLFGIWLGDGTSRSGEITTADKEVIEYIQNAGYEVHKRDSSDYAYRVVGLTTQLKVLGVLNNKHIPMMYLRASKEQRMALLQGLMDSDGHAREHGGVEFTNTNLELVKGVKELIHSLGWKVTIREGKTTFNKKNVGVKYRLTFTPSEYVFRIKRKREKQKLPKTNRTKYRFIKEIIPIESVPVKCIQVEGGMFLCHENMIPTHNSCALVMEALAYGLEYPRARIYLFRETYDDLEANLIAEMKEKWSPELYDYNETKHIATLINGSKVFFRYVRNYQDAEKYQGRSMDFVGVDELTKHEERSIQVLLSCLRSPLGYPPRFRATCNPGG